METTTLTSRQVEAPETEAPRHAPRTVSRPLSPVTRVTVRYSKLGNYLSVARQLADAIRQEFADVDVRTELIPSPGGVYEVGVNGKLVFSKRATYRLPSPDEIFYHVRAAVTAKSPKRPPVSLAPVNLA
jgi:selenoprotein W-related protein